ncbi:OmpH family outer membrane protein [Rhodobacteraceae bacterium M382]|nr:OmpH family outer membrane protein [Rhodobacteraceae bacterium M382]
MLAIFVSLAFLAFETVEARAQQLGIPQSVILTIASERLFAESKFGRRVARLIEAESAVLAAENRQIEAQLTTEEQELTDRRPGMDADAFRVLANAFDEKVRQIRREQDAKARALAQQSDNARIEFLNAAAPVLETMMRDAKASVILERASVFLSANATDVTDLAIARIDLVLGDGAITEQDPDQ